MLNMLPENIGVAPIFDPDKTPGGLWIPDEAKERCDQGIVKYVGSRVPEDFVKIGDYVLFSGYTGSMVRLVDELTIVMSYKFVIAKFADEAVMVPHLYFQGVDGEFIPANSHQAFELIRNAYYPINVKAEKPKIEDYNVHANR